MNRERSSSPFVLPAAAGERGLGFEALFLKLPRRRIVWWRRDVEEEEKESEVTEHKRLWGFYGPRDG